jgi:hypothetical protein
MRWAGYVACIEQIKMQKEFLSEYLKGIYQAEYLGVNAKIILGWILGKQRGKLWTGWMWLRIETSSGEHGNEPSVSVTGVEFLD